MRPDIDHDIFEEAPIGLLYSENRRMVRFNKTFCEMFGYDAAELDGRSLEMLYASAEEFHRTGTRWTKVLGEHGHHKDERIMKRCGAGLFWCRVRGRALDIGQPLARAIWAFADLSAERVVPPLTARERQVGVLLVEGLTAKEIARRLDISHRTVHVHKGRLMKRFGVHNSLELVRILTNMPEV